MSKQKLCPQASARFNTRDLRTQRRITLNCALPVALALLFCGISLARSQSPSPSTAPNPKLPTLFLIGDSTVRNGRGDGAGGQWGWGDLIGPFFDQSKINIVNSAIGGRSSRTYMTDGHWDQVLGRLKPGDFVIMQFGHNDGGEINDTSRARGTLRGIGDETQEIDNLLTKKHEVVHTFGWYLRKFTADIRARGATPIICSLIPRKIWKDGKIVRNTDTYAGWAADVARVEHVAFVDLNEIIARKYDELGPDPVEPLFADPHTHTSLAGAQLNARCVVEGLRSLKPNPLATFIRSQPLDFSKPPAPAPPPRTISLNFDFGPGKPAPGHIQVLSSTLYTAGLGYGFERGSVVSCEGPGGANSHIGSCSASEPFFFSVALPEGNYNVTVSLGDQAAESTTTVRAELRRLMLESIHAARGETQTMTFTVNVRTPRISTGGEVKLKDREKTSEAWAWDEKLTLEFRGTHPALRSLEIKTATDAVTLFVLGDSTVCDQPQEPFNSWGQMLTRFFRPGIAIANHAESGESLKSSLGARRLDKVLGLIKPGDYLFIQYGHNDEKERGEGVGAFTTYKTDLKRFVAEARQRGGIPVLITPAHRRTFDAAGKITNSHGDYPEAVRQAAREDNVPLIDLNAMSKSFYEALGPEASKQAFAAGDGTHHNSYGSYELARCIVEGIKAYKLGISKYLVDDVMPFDPSHPDPLERFTAKAGLPRPM
ncbi:MAG TPA: rhamnogalacturonan acetylesterase [Blastocatellia bacterium]|nr:rhamnogalacturonan acetylesterase [Blastocatellia bacterium]